jgi:hypothetical protein
MIDDLADIHHAGFEASLNAPYFPMVNPHAPPAPMNACV